MRVNYLPRREAARFGKVAFIRKMHKINITISMSALS
jgi:hypothetical protein